MLRLSNMGRGTPTLKDRDHSRVLQWLQLLLFQLLSYPSDLTAISESHDPVGKSQKLRRLQESGRYDNISHSPTAHETECVSPYDSCFS